MTGHLAVFIAIFRAFKLQHGAGDDFKPWWNPRSNSIQRLPGEMLAAIFEGGARITFQDDRENLPFIVAVSHVCRYWRAVAYSFPGAWCCIPVHPQRDAMTRLFLARSEGHLLEICFHRGTSPASTRRALKLVEPSAPRWTRLCIRAYNIWAMLRLSNPMHDMVRLRAFELRFEYNSQFDFYGTPWECLDTIPPSTLESVILTGMTIMYPSPILHGLTRLTLADSCRPSHEEFRQLCLQNPHLEYLKLQNVFPVMYQSQYDADREWGPFVLNSLRTFELVVDMEGEDRVGYVERFFGALTVPVLCELSFKSKRQLAWEGLGETIWTGGLVWDHVRILHFVPSGPVNFRYVVDSVLVFRMFPKLEHFTFHPADDKSTFSFLQRWIIHMPANDSKAVDQKTAKDSLKLLEGLRLWNDQYFELYVW